ncbi:hypothetical protein TNIN_89591 [Trichonephila inaurata madagascariensis]|uniref:Uncharacterized protein n=1 Tax=Trichonephila inaurata madagascariensis TaxID=2747483 RepID=A0A8X6YSU7_9ARAC|nr:hypothetical protein TNIN_89591 [Trichonephila inaurata madagascariensis]
MALNTCSLTRVVAGEGRGHPSYSLRRENFLGPNDESVHPCLHEDLLQGRVMVSRVVAGTSRELAFAVQKSRLLMFPNLNNE